MCVGSVCATTLADQIRSGDHQLAIQKLDDDELPSFDDECVDSLIASLPAVFEDTNPLTRRQAYEVLEQLALHHPRVVVDHLQTISNHTDIGEERVAGPYARTLLTLAETNPEALQQVRTADLVDLCGIENNEIRADGARILQYHDSAKAMKILVEKLSYEIDPVKTAVEESLEQRRDDALSRLESTREDVEEKKLSDALRDLKYLSREAPDFIIEQSARLRVLLGTSNGESAAAILGRALRSEQDPVLIDELFDSVDIDPHQSAKTRRQAEHALIALADAHHVSPFAEPVISNCRGWLSTDDIDIREHAMTQIRTLAEVTPDLVKEQLSEIGASAEDEPALTALLGEVLRNLGEADSDPISYLETVLGGRNERSAVNHLIRTAEALRYRPPGSTRFISPELGTLNSGALENLHAAVEAERSVPIIWPTFEPRLVVLLAIEILLDGLNERSDVVLFSPGSQNHWGNKTEIRDEYARYGIEVPVNRRSETVPLPSIVPHARITESGIQEDSGGEAQTRLVITKRLEELDAIESPGIVLLNLFSRTKEEFDAAINDVMERFGRETVIPIYSNMTKHEQENRAPRFGPPPDVGGVDTLPGVDTLEAVQSAKGSTTLSSNHIGETDTLFTDLLDAPPIEIVGVDDDGLIDCLEKGSQVSTQLRKDGRTRAAGRVFSKLMMFQRFPLPIRRYESWVAEERRSGGVYGPRTVRSLIDGLQSYAGKIEETATATEVFQATEYLGHARETLLDKNSMYEALCTRVELCLGADERVAVFMPKATWRRAVRAHLLEDDVITERMLEAGDFQLVHPDSAREIDACDELITIGPQRPQYSFIHLLPRVERTTVFTYRAEWDWMVKQNNQQFVDRLNEAVAGIDYTPYTPPEVDVREVENPSWLDQPQGGFGTVERVSESGKQESPREIPPARGQGSARRTLAEVFDGDWGDDYDSSGGNRYDDHERREFCIETTDGQIFNRRSRVIRRRETASSEGRYHWVSPSVLSPGETIVIIEQSVFRELWDEWLTETYSEALGDTEAFEHLEIWHSMVNSILATAMAETGTTSPINADVRRWILQRTGSIDRESQTIWRWFTSVANASSPLEMAQDPDLTMGPQQAEDIEAIARLFDRSEIDEQTALVIEESLNRIRGANASQGHEFRESIREQLNSMDDNEVKQAANRYEVAEVTELE